MGKMGTGTCLTFCWESGINCTGTGILSLGMGLKMGVRFSFLDAQTLS